MVHSHELPNWDRSPGSSEGNVVEPLLEQLIEIIHQLDGTPKHAVFYERRGRVTPISTASFDVQVHEADHVPLFLLQLADCEVPPGPGIAEEL